MFSRRRRYHCIDRYRLFYDVCLIMMRLVEFQEQYLSSSVKSGPRLKTTVNGRTVRTIDQGNIGELYSIFISNVTLGRASYAVTSRRLETR